MYQCPSIHEIGLPSAEKQSNESIKEYKYTCTLVEYRSWICISAFLALHMNCDHLDLQHRPIFVMKDTEATLSWRSTNRKTQPPLRRNYNSWETNPALLTIRSTQPRFKPGQPAFPAGTSGTSTTATENVLSNHLGNHSPHFFGEIKK